METMFTTHVPGFTLRLATKQDCPLILQLIRELAVYEKMEDQVTATAEKLEDTLFSRKQAEVLIGELEGAPVAFALFFHNYSTFLGKAGIYLEDIYVRESLRGKGLGGAIFNRLATIALERGCARLDWSCLNWNTSAIGFYNKLGATPMDDWRLFRLQGAALEKVGGKPAK